ncbi:unannotated protein [freshwater metagenome]|uniref:Unannotated protein n=1 Tax=freshwater metagenome TaxID=449393 RepID=A0A6J6YAY9_9ZZZZ
MVEVKAECDVGEDVQRSNGCTIKTAGDIGIRVAVDEVWVRPAPRQIGQMPKQEEADDDAAPAHGASRPVHCHIVTR